MIVFCVAAYSLVQMKIDLWVLLTTFGAIRLSLVVPTLYIIFAKTHLEWRMLAASILLAIVVGFYLQTVDISKFSLIWISIRSQNVSATEVVACLCILPSPPCG